MNFKIPDYKLGSTVWFLNEEDKLFFGKVTMCTLCFTDTSTSIYYGIEIDDETNYTIKETDIIPHSLNIPKPKYEVGDTVSYQFPISKNECKIAIGLIEKIDISMYNRQEGEILYIMDDDPDYWVLEDDIINFADTKAIKELEYDEA